MSVELESLLEVAAGQSGMEWIAGAENPSPEGAGFDTSPENQWKTARLSKAAPSNWPKSLGRAAYHGPLGELVKAIEPHSEADPAALLVCSLVYFGSIIGRAGYFQVEGTRHHSNLYAVLVGDTAKGRKGTTDGRIRRAFLDIAPDMDGKIVEGMSSGEGLIWAVRDPIIATEPIKQKGQVTGYQEVTKDPGVDDKRLLVVEGEYAQVLKVVGREGNTLSPVIRRAWDGGGILSTITKNSPATATDPHISIIGHITSMELRERLDDCEAANGFANRFLWCCTRRSKCLPEGGGDTDNATASSRAKLTDAIAWGKKIEYPMARDAEAKALWAKVYPGLSEGGRGLTGALTNRAEAQVTRLAMVYAIVDQSPWVKPVHLRAGLAVWEYCEASAHCIFGSSQGRERRALKIIEEAGGEMTARNLQNRLPTATAEQAVELLRTLVEAGHGSFGYEGSKAVPTFRMTGHEGGNQ